MIVNVYILMQPGADRPYVSTTPPHKELAEKPGTKLWRAEIEVPGFDRVDGVLAVSADSILPATLG
jgi:hypothetical protein